MKTMTIRNIPAATAAALDAEKRHRGLSLNRTVLALIDESLGLHGKKRSNGLGRFAGTWSAEDFKQFEKAVASFGEIDEDMWR